MARIYVSSTSADLADHRKEVSQALRRLGHEDVAMEYYVAEDARPVERCLSDVRSCDVYVGIFAWRYGHVPAERNPDDRSITELEYRRALADGKECLIFLLGEDAAWPRNRQDKDLSRIEVLRAELAGGRHTVNFFATADELARKASEAVTAWEKRNAIVIDREPADWLAYREAVLYRHQWVRLQVIAGAGRQRDPLRIPLTEVFEPQLVIQGVPGTDVPDEVRQYQREIYGASAAAPHPVGTADSGRGEDGHRAIDPAVDTDLPRRDPTARAAVGDGGDGRTAVDADPLVGQVFAGSPEQVLGVLGRERTQVFLGGPGAGKSSLLQYAMLRVCGAEAAGVNMGAQHLAGQPIPFLVELRAYVLDDHPDFVSHIVSRSKDVYGAELDPDSVSRALEGDGRAIVFFDGLDEVFDSHDRRRVIDQFRAFARLYPGCRTVVTSRIAGYDPTSLGLARFTHYMVMPLTVAHIRDFAGRWYRHYSLEGTGRTAEGLVQRIIESPRLLDLAGNPLLLTMMAVIYKDRDLPTERYRLYQRCAETLLEDWDLAGKGIGTEDFKLAVEIRTEQKSQMLQQVARYMLEHARPADKNSGSELNAIAYGPLQDVLVRYLSAKYQRAEGEAAAIAVSILQHLMERTYVLAGVGERIFGFVHRTFMEYFAACDCLREFNNKGADFDWLNREIIGEHWQDPAWEEVLPLLIAMLHGQGTPISKVIGHVRGSSPTSSPHRVAAAARLLGQAGIPQDQAQGKLLLLELAEAVAGHPIRDGEGPDEFMMKALGAFADLASVVTAPDEVRECIASLNTSGKVAGRFAGWQMGFALRTRKERLDYAVAAVKDSEEAVRLGAIAALEHEWPGRTDLGPVLAEVVRTDSESRVSLAALTAVQRSWRYEPAILDAIDGRADSERSYKVVRRFIEYLAAAWPGNVRALEVLLSLASPERTWPQDASAFIASAAAAALIRGWPVQDIAAAFVLNQGRLATETIVRQAVIDGLGAQRPGEAGVLAFLRERAVDDDAPSVRAAALLAITANCQADDGVKEFVLGRAVDDPSPSVRSAVAWAIVGSWPEQGLRVKSFISDRAVNDGAPSVRAALIKLRHLSSVEENAEFLRKRAVADPEASVRTVALLELSRIAEVTDSQRFVTERVTDDADPVVRCGVLRAIAPMIHPYSWAAPLIKARASQDSVPEVRAIALSGLAHQWPFLSAGGQAFVRDRASRDPNAIVRKAAILEIGRKSHCDPGQAGDRLSLLKRRAATDKAASVRQAALSALIEAEQWLHLHDTQKFIENRVINDRSAGVRGATLRSIMRSPIFRRAEYRALVLDRAANDPNEGLRAALSAELHR